MKDLKNVLDFIGAEYRINKLPERVLWGVATTGDIHLGYLPSIKLLKYFKSKGSTVILLLANYHAYLDSEKTKWEEMKERMEYYRNVFSKFGFTKKDMVETKDIYTKSDYIEGFLKFSRFLPLESLINYAGRTLKSFYTKDYRLSDLIYVALQIFDIIYFNLDMVICGQDESKIYKLGIPKVQKAINRRVDYIYLPLIAGVLKEEMHASDPRSNKILLEVMSEKEIYNQIIKSNLLMQSLQKFILPIMEMSATKEYYTYTCEKLVRILYNKIKEEQK